LESEEKKIGCCFGGIKNENLILIILLFILILFFCFLEYVNEGGQVRSGQVRSGQVRSGHPKP
jgi:hypothetical protein